MWIESSIDIRGQSVGLSLHLLERDERERTAATIAWFVHLIESGREDEAGERFVESIIGGNVEFTIPEDQLDGLSESWWTEATGRAAVEFVRVNELGGSLNRFLQMEEKSEGQQARYS